MNKAHHQQAAVRQQNQDSRHAAGRSSREESGAAARAVASSFSIEKKSAIGPARFFTCDEDYALFALGVPTLM